MDAQENGFSNSLFAICQTMVSSLELNEVLATILDLSMQTMQADTGSVLLYESGSDQLKMLAAKGLPEEVMRRGHISRKGSVAEWVIDHNEPQIIQGRVNSQSGYDSVDKTGAIRSSMVVPLRAKGQVIGTLNLNRTSGKVGAFTQDDLNTMMILASQAALCIDNARLHGEITRQERLAAIGQTVAGLSHCIKNMLSGLRGGVGLLELAHQAKTWETHAKGLDILKRSVDRISYLVLDMLDYSKEKTPIRQAIPVAKLVVDVYETVTHKANSKNVTLCHEIAPECGAIRVDSNQIFRCLLNLVENAIDAVGAENGEVWTRCDLLEEESAKAVFGENAEVDKMGKVLRIAVQDNGQGIDQEHMQSIFQPFFSTKASKGTGLGLAVTRKIIEEHGGTITVQSEKGHGATFHIIIPEINPKEIPEESEDQLAANS